MLRTRVIPCLLLRNAGLVKTVRFKDPTYVGDPINAVKIFNEKEVDELVFLDISATAAARGPNFSIIEDIASECFMPLGYGGGLRNIDDVKRVLSIGVEKVIINSFAVESPDFITKVADAVGSQSVVVSIDVKKTFLGGYKVFSHSGSRDTKQDPVSYAKKMAELGAGEILLTSIDRDGTQQGYDLELIKMVSEAVELPVVACGGAKNVDDFGLAVNQGGASAVAAGSMFVFHGKHRAVLINFPTQNQLAAVLGNVSNEQSVFNSYPPNT